MVMYKVSDNGKMEEFKQEDFGLENYEKKLEEWIERNPSVIFDGETIFFIKKEKRGEKTEDLLGIDKDGNTIIIELKAGKGSREVIAQAIEYAASVKKLVDEQLKEKAIQYFNETKSKYTSLQHAYNSVFSKDEEDEIPIFNQKQRIIIVGQEIDDDLEKVARYLRENYEMDIHCIKFSYYKTGSGEVILETSRIVGREDTDRPKIGRDFAEGRYKEFFDTIISNLKERLSDNLKNFDTNPARGKYLDIFYKECKNIYNFGVRIFPGKKEIWINLWFSDLKDKLSEFLKNNEKNIEGKLNIKIERKKFEIHKNGIWELISKYEQSPENTELIAERLKFYIETLKPILDEFLEKNKV